MYNFAIQNRILNSIVVNQQRLLNTAFDIYVGKIKIKNKTKLTLKIAKSDKKSTLENKIAFKNRR